MAADTLDPGALVGPSCLLLKLWPFIPSGAFLISLTVLSVTGSFFLFLSHYDSHRYPPVFSSLMSIVMTMKFSTDI